MLCACCIILGGIFNLKLIQYIQEGTGARVISACVEIVFDNSDNRLPVS